MLGEQSALEPEQGDEEEESAEEHKRGQQQGTGERWRSPHGAMLGRGLDQLARWGSRMGRGLQHGRAPLPR